MDIYTGNTVDRDVITYGKVNNQLFLRYEVIMRHNIYAFPVLKEDMVVYNKDTYIVLVHIVLWDTLHRNTHIFVTVH